MKQLNRDFKVTSGPSQITVIKRHLPVLKHVRWAGNPMPTEYENCCCLYYATQYAGGNKKSILSFSKGIKRSTLRFQVPNIKSPNPIKNSDVRKQGSSNDYTLNCNTPGRFIC